MEAEHQQATTIEIEPPEPDTAEVEPAKEHAEPESSSESEKETKSPDEDLLKALRGFVRRANGQAEPEKKEESQPIGRLQAAVLLIVVLDVVLLHSEFQHWFENPVFQFALKVAPWLLGATAFTYSDSVRKWVLSHCSRPSVGILALGLLVPLVFLRQPLFSVRVRVASDSITVSSEDNRIISARQDARVFLVTLPDLSKPYKINIKDDRNSSATPFSLTLGRWRVARATFAQIPLFGRLFGASEVVLAPLYQVSTKSSKPGAYADVEGEFQEGFFQSQTLASIGCSLTKPSRSGFRAIRCSLQPGIDALNVPLGKYLITMVRGTCKKTLPQREILQDTNEPIDVDALCSQ